MVKDGETKWFTDNMSIVRKHEGWEYTGNSQTEYAEPAWLNKLKLGDRSILNLDKNCSNI